MQSNQDSFGPNQFSDELERCEERLKALEEERASLLKKIGFLRTEKISRAKEWIEPRPSVPSKDKTLPVFSSQEKLDIFRSLFRGRTDVFPKLWINPNKGTKGYAPACFNEWAPNICGKPQVKCGECPNQAFIPVDDQAMLNHLQGRHTLGVYPMLHDESCWFLAIDFDKSTWKQDVKALAETCQNVGLACSVERSRSGNGAHVWLFFESPVPAVQARKMGCFLVTETMSHRHELSMESYDRLFPNQDTMPKGGFGNLIALPLQYEPRQHGNTVFLDQDLNPIPDQWGYLSSIKRITFDHVEAIANEASRKGKVTGVRFAEQGDDEDTLPWNRPPSGKSEFARVSGPVPTEIKVTVAQKLFVEKVGLPSPLINQIKRVAAFQNPEFYKKQSLRLSTALTPRIITCAEETPEYICLPRGSMDDLEELMQGYGTKVKTEDRRNPGKDLALKFQGDLSELQTKAAQLLLKHDIGVLVAPPGMGKTVMGIFMAVSRGLTTLILVHRAPLLDQWVSQLSLFLGISEKEIGRIGAGKRKPNGKLDVAMIQSLTRKGKVEDLVADYGHVIVDECHHLPALSFEKVLAEVKARYILGLTATPQRRDGLHPIISMQLGPVRFAVNAKKQGELRPFHHRLVVRETRFALENPLSKPTIQELYSDLVKSQSRNQIILEDVLAALKENRSPILLTERKEHLDYFREKLQDKVRHLVILQGGMTSKKRKASTSQITEIPEGEERLVLATGRFIGEGFDDARLDTLFLAAPISWKGTLVQYAGRLHRKHPGKKEVRIYDYLDNSVPMLMRMFDKRMKTYRALGYAQNDSIGLNL